MTLINQHLYLALEVSEQLAYTNQTRPFLGWVFLLQAIMPCAKKPSGYARLLQKLIHNHFTN